MRNRVKSPVWRGHIQLSVSAPNFPIELGRTHQTDVGIDLLDKHEILVPLKEGFDLHIGSGILLRKALPPSPPQSFSGKRAKVEHPVFIERPVPIETPLHIVGHIHHLVDKGDRQSQIGSSSACDLAQKPSSR